MRSVTVTDAERRGRDTHSAAAVLAVVAVLLLHLYLFTIAPRLLGVPGPGSLVAALGGPAPGDDVPRWTASAVDPVDWDQPLTLGRFAPSDDELERHHRGVLGFHLSVFGAFLCAYFLPLELKLGAIALWTLCGVGSLYGVRAVAGLLAAHLVVYLVFHPGRRFLLALVPGFLAGLAFGPASFTGALIGSAALAGLGALAYLYVVLRLLASPAIARVLRTVVAQSAMITVVGAALLQGFSGREPTLALGLLLFFWQWQRTILYHIDYADGFVPRDLPLQRYLGIFLTPGSGAYWDWFNVIGQGYGYASNSFLAEDKNRIVLSGARILLLAAVYLACWDWFRYLLVRAGDAFGVALHGADTWVLVERFTAGESMTTATVLATTLADLFRWLVVVGGMVHFKVGLWRICGYRIDPFFDRPWRSTNLVAFWARFTYHYREFLVRAFYYPVFLRYFKKHPRVRIVAATLAAATFGNMIWGHVPEEMYDGGLRFENFGEVLRTWPHFLLLGLGISVAELYALARRKTRRAWTPGPRILLDLLAAYGTLQFYALITIFRRPAEDTTLWDMVRLVLVGLGIHL